MSRQCSYCGGYLWITLLPREHFAIVECVRCAREAGSYRYEITASGVRLIEEVSLHTVEQQIRYEMATSTALSGG